MHLPRVLPFLLASIVVADAASQPTSPYAPKLVACDDGVVVRPASKGLSDQEQAWLSKRLKNVEHSLQSYLPRVDIPGFDVQKYLKSIGSSHIPRAGLAISGGGTQSGLGGLGLWQAFDDRYEPAVKARTGGLTQCLSYLTGLSGGGFVTVVPLATNNFSTVTQLRKAADFTTNYITGTTGNATQLVVDSLDLAYTKFAVGLPVSVTDIFGQYFRQYLPKSWAFKSYSGIATEKDHSFALGLGPMPIVTYAEVVPESSPEIGNIMYPGGPNANLSSYELTPFEFGSWLGGRVQAFIPTSWLGTSMHNGKPQNKSQCVQGFDKVTFAQGSTGNAFNFWLIDAFFNIPLFQKRDQLSDPLLKRQKANNTIVVPEREQGDPNVELIEFTMETFDQSFNRSMWARYPNPFQGFGNTSIAGVDELLLVDGSETGETIPLRPLIVPERKLDFIIAFDSTLDGDFGWVNGTDFINSAKTANQLKVPFPNVPDVDTMVNLQIVKYPTFFGCEEPDVPLVLYIPNAPWSAYSNYSFEKSSFTNHQIDLVLQNNLDMVNFNTSQFPYPTTNHVPPFSTCLACGLIDRSLAKVGMQVPEACKQCLDRFCWNGTKAGGQPQGYNPGLILDPEMSYERWNATVWNGKS